VHGDLTAQLAAYQVIVLEGCDGTGKTTLAAALALQHGYQVIHSGRTPDGTDLADRYQALLTIPGKIILDRSFISELVYGPLDHGRSRLTIPDAADLARRVGARSGVLVHLTGNPDAITARLRTRDGPTASAADRIRAIISTYRDTFAILDGTAPIITADTTTPGHPNPPPGPGAAGLRLGSDIVLHQDTVRQAVVHARSVPGDLHLDLLLQINASHLGQAQQVDRDVSQFLPHAHASLPPRVERLGHLPLQQAELQGHIGRVEAFPYLVLPGQLLPRPDIHDGPPSPDLAERRARGSKPARVNRYRRPQSLHQRTAKRHASGTVLCIAMCATQPGLWTSPAPRVAACA